MRFTTTLVSMLFSIALSCAPPLAHAQTNAPLTVEADITEIGSWSAPPNDGSGRDERGSFDYTQRGLMAVEGTRGWFSCHDWHSSLAEIVMPALGGVAKVTHPCAQPPNLLGASGINPGDPNSQKLGGALFAGGRLIVSAFSYYDGNGTQRASHWVGADTASLVGPLRLGATIKPRMIGGYMGHIPEPWATLLGGSAGSGKCCTAVISQTSQGPTLSVFEPSTVGKSDPSPATLLLGYPADHPTLGTWGQVNNVYGSTDDVGGFAIPPGSRSLLFFGRHGKTHCYGSGTSDASLHGKPDGQGNVWCYDPVDGSKGTHGFPYRYRVWAYDLNELLAVKQGKKQPWDVLPYGVWDLPTPSTSGAYVAGAVFDPTLRRMHVNGGGRVSKVYSIAVPSGDAVPPPTADVTVDTNVEHQTMRGWEVQNEAQKERADYEAYRQTAVDKVAEAGINRIRFEVRAGIENPTDHYATWVAAGYPNGSTTAGQTWRAKRYETVNDNSDPNVINPAGFHFTEIDSVAEKLVNPLRAKLAAKGESLYVNLNYVAFLQQVTSGVPYVHKNPAEYAEMMLATFQHLQTKYGWVPDAVEVILEPDNTQSVWNGTQVGQVIVATGDRLAAAGFHPDFVGPSTTCLGNAPSWFDALVAVPGVASYIKELSYHRYCGVSTANLQSIAAKSLAAGISSSMLEMWDPFLSHHTLHEDIKIGRNGAWQQAAFVDLNSENGIGLVYINPATPTVATFTNLTKFTSLYYRWVRMHAKRVDATTSLADVDPLAFKNVDGTVTVVSKTTQGRTFTLGGLPAGVYGVAYASSFTNAVGTLPDQTIASGGVVTVAMPTSGVVTVYGKSAAPPVGVDCVEGPWVADAVQPPWLPLACPSTGQRTRTESWSRSVLVQPVPPGRACGPLTETRPAVQACDYEPPLTASATIATKTCTFTLSANQSPQDGLTGWGVQFYRKLEGATQWVAHNQRDAEAPFVRASDVPLGRWVGQAVWSRTGSVSPPAVPISGVYVCEP